MAKKKFKISTELAIVAAILVVVFIVFYNNGGLTAKFYEGDTGETSVQMLSDFLNNPPLDPNGEPQNWQQTETDEYDVYFAERTINGAAGSAIVELDQDVYAFSKADGTLFYQKTDFRTDLPRQLPEGLITKEAAEALVEGESKRSDLYYISPDSTVFPQENLPSNFDRTNPVWVIWSTDANGFAKVTVINAATGEVLGNGINPPAAAYALTGPLDCNADGTNNGELNYYRDIAASWFNRLGYTTTSVSFPSREDVKSQVQNSNVELFFSVAHSNSQKIVPSCDPNFRGPIGEGKGYKFVSNTDIESWIKNVPAKKLAYLMGCDSLCSTGQGTLSYAFRKGSNVGTTTVGFCGLGDTDGHCQSCLNMLGNWQNSFFTRVADEGLTVKKSFDLANVAWPTCLKNQCTRFAGDANFRLVPKNVATYEVATPFPVDGWGSLGWTDCSNMAGGNAGADAFCKCKGYYSATDHGYGACYQESKSSRNAWTAAYGTTACISPGANTGAGWTTTKIKCENPFGEVLTPFPVDGWGATGWTSCSNMAGGNAGADAFCKCKGYDKVYKGGDKACYQLWISDRYAWTPAYDTAACLSQSEYKFAGYATTKIRCEYTAVKEVATPFAVDGWGSAGWTSCNNMAGGTAGADAFCKCKGYNSAYNGGDGACYQEWVSSRNAWTAAYDKAACISAGKATENGYATTKIKCI